MGDKDTHLRERTRTTVVGEGGEVVDQVIDRYLVENDSEFFLFYCKGIALFKDLKLPEIKLLAWVMKSAGFNNNMVVITSGVKDIIGKEMDLAVSSISNSLPKLVKSGFLYRNDNGKRDGVYYINPEYFWKGDISERKKTLKYIMEVRLADKK